MRLVLGTRKSALALAQSRAFARALEIKVAGLAVEELQVVTSGDKSQATNQPLVDIGGKGLFIKELEEALLDGRAHFAVHSIKDVPAVIAPGCVLACVPAREDPRDALVSKTGEPLARLAAGSRVGTSSLRRALAIKEARPDLEVVPIRGNVDTRLRKTEDGTVEAVILALAGLKRLGLEARASELLDPAISLPAIGQGALGIECREGDTATIEALLVMRDAETSIAVAAERAVMAAVDGSCRMPVAAHAVHEGPSMVLRGLLAEADGSRPRRGIRTAPWPEDEAEAARIGDDLGAELKSRGEIRSAVSKRG